MNLSDLKPAASLARRYGIKVVIYGGPGSGKTPLVNTAPAPVLLVTEPGMLSMRNSPIKHCRVAETYAEITDFMVWFFKSAEARQFQTLAIDSISNVAEIILAEALAKEKHGKKAYGTMSEKVMQICNSLFHMPEKHIVLIAKQGFAENGKQTIIQGGEVSYEPIMQKRPFFPGKDLNVKIPHLFDSVFHLGEAVVPGQPKPVRALRTKEITEVFARERSGLLSELEPPDLGAIFKKCMQ